GDTPDLPQDQRNIDGQEHKEEEDLAQWNAKSLRRNPKLHERVVQQQIAGQQSQQCILTDARYRHLSSGAVKTRDLLLPRKLARSKTCGRGERGAGFWVVEFDQRARQIANHFL